VRFGAGGRVPLRGAGPGGRVRLSGAVAGAQPGIALPPRPSSPPSLRLQDARGRRERWLRGLAIAGPCALAAVLASWELSTRSLWLDEGATVSIVSQHGSALWAAIAHDGGNMLVYYLVLHVLVGLFGDGPTLLRIPSVIATVGTVWLSGLIGARLFDRRVAFAAALLTAVSLPLIFWGQDARGYAPLVTFVTASFYFYVRIVERPEPPGRRLLLAYGACTVLACYMQLVAALIVPAQLLALLVRREHARAILRTLLVGFVLCLPLLVLATIRGANQLFWVPSPNIEGIGQTLRWITSSGMPPNFSSGAVADVLLALTLLALGVALGLLARRELRVRVDLRAHLAGAWTREDRFSLLALLGWLVMPMAISLAESAEGQPILLYRNSVVCLPAVALLLAWLLLRTRLPRAAGWAGVGVFLALRAAVLLPTYGVSPENWKAAEAYVLAHARPGDCVAFYPLDARMPFDYYVRVRRQEFRAPVPVDPVAPWYQPRPFVEEYAVPSGATIRRIESSCPRVWFVASHEGQIDGPQGSLTNYIRYRIFQDQLQSVYARHDTHIFGWAAEVAVELLFGRQLPPAS
jgi:mannosyltransferase